MRGITKDDIEDHPTIARRQLFPELQIVATGVRKHPLTEGGWRQRRRIVRDDRALKHDPKLKTPG